MESTPSQPDQRFPKSIRLRTQAEFDRVHAGDYFAADQTLVLKAVLNGLSASRLGMSISKRVGNAVVRNRWKRLIREAFRRQKSGLPVGLDIIVRPRKGAQCEYDPICCSLKKLAAAIDRRIRKSNAAPPGSP